MNEGFKTETGMIDARNSINYNNRLVVFFCVLVFFSIIYSVFLQSVSMFALLVLAFLDIRIQPLAIRFHKGLWQKIRSFFRSPNYWPLLILFFVPLLTGLYSESQEDWAANLRVRLPFLGLPVIFFLLPKLNLGQVQLILKSGLLVAFVSGLYISVDFFLHQAEYVELIRVGKSIPTPTHHVRYSLWIGFMTICGGILLVRKWYSSRTEKRLLLIAVLFLFVFMHLLSVRSGLATMYLMGALLLFLHILHTKRYMLGLAALVLMVSLPVLAVQFIPSLHQKFHYSKWDWKMYQTGQGFQYSDSERFQSMYLGWKIFTEHPLIGIGTGDMTDQMREEFRAQYDIDRDILPHNEFLYLLAATGILGATLSLCGFLTPFLYRQKWRDPFLLALFMLIFFSFLVEIPLETSVGVSIFLIPFFVFMHRQADP